MNGVRGDHPSLSIFYSWLFSLTEEGGVTLFGRGLLRLACGVPW